MKVYTFELRVVETRQDTRDAFDESRTKREVAELAISIALEGDSPPGRMDMATAFRTLEVAACEALGEAT